MRPVPTAFHIGPLEIHTYGIGLALTFWFAYWYFERRLRARQVPTDWLAGAFVYIIVAAVVGARALHVLSNLGTYTHQPVEILAVWHGGLSSFGGLLFAVPTGIIVQRRRCPQLSTARALDIVAPVLMAAWAMGRLLGPQLMVAGGGHPSHQWFCMYYAGQPGCRLPVPIFQSIEDFTVFVVLILIERRLERWPDGTPRTNTPCGVVLGTGMVLWGIERTIDEHLWLGETGVLGSDLVQVAGILLVLGGIVVLLRSRRQWRAWLAAGAPGGHGEPAGAGVTGTGSASGGSSGGESATGSDDAPDHVSVDGPAHELAADRGADRGAAADASGRPDEPRP